MHSDAAIKGKKYSLTKEHGPWMIMVTSVWGETKEQYERASKSHTTSTCSLALSVLITNSPLTL